MPSSDPRLKRIDSLIRRVPDFPTPGVLFYDIVPALADPQGLQAVTELLAESVTPDRFDYVAGIEARGLIFASLLAYGFGKGLLLIRKGGKLPGQTTKVVCSLEYGQTELELSQGVVQSGARVLLVDDVLATGGTAAGAVSLLQSAGAVVHQALILIELPALNGRAVLPGQTVVSVLRLGST